MQEITQLSEEHLPFRLRQSVFKRFEPILRQALDSPLEPHSWNPAPLRPTTAAARMRDAITSLKRFQWPSSFTYEEWKASKLVITHDDYNVHIRVPIRGHEFKHVIRDGFTKANGLRVESAQLSDVVLNALIVLVERKILPTPVLLIGYVPSDELRSKLEMEHDIAFAISEDLKQTAIL